MVENRGEAPTAGSRLFVQVPVTVPIFLPSIKQTPYSVIVNGVTIFTGEIKCQNNSFFTTADKSNEFRYAMINGFDASTQ
jgi:hypothetical protein